MIFIDALLSEHPCLNSYLCWWPLRGPPLLDNKSTEAFKEKDLESYLYNSYLVSLRGYTGSLKGYGAENVETESSLSKEL